MYKVSIYSKYHFLRKNVMNTITKKTYFHVIWNSILIFNSSRASNRVNHKRGIFKVSSSILVPRSPHSGLGKIITLTKYSSVLMWFTWNWSIYNSIPVLLAMIRWPQLSLGPPVLAGVIKANLFELFCAALIICESKKGLTIVKRI